MSEKLVQNLIWEFVMKSARKLRVAVLYGGRSGEHEVSLRSAASVIQQLDRERFEIIPVAIDKEGRWHLNDIKLLQADASVLPVYYKDAPFVMLPPNPSIGGGENSLVAVDSKASGSLGAVSKFDVIFPVMHGPLCEDGAIQGLLELADVAYVGCGVLASAVGMDKEIAKRLIQGVGLPIVPYVALKHVVWKRDPAKFEAQIAKELGFPCFVKPANMGSSVGVHKVKEPSALRAALEDSFKYDTKVLVEKAINAREVEVSVLENSEAGLDPLVSVPGEIAPTHEFYSYESKYIDENGANLMIPAKLTPEQTRMAQEIGRRAFMALECEGMARVDMFVDKVTGEFYFNEVNTLPGFTSISMYPKMWEASGVPYKELLSRLVDLAMARHERKAALVRDFHSK
jgi:D-alanine-D-alanine ligase